MFLKVGKNYGFTSKLTLFEKRMVETSFKKFISNMHLLFFLRIVHIYSNYLI